MAIGGITFGASKDSIRMVVDNGVAANDPRVLRRTNEATNELLLATDPRTGTTLVPVGTMLTAEVSTDADGVMLLPPELENALSWTVKAPRSGYGNADVSQGWYEIVNPFTYVDPSAAHDNPLDDLGLVPDPLDASILRRSYRYPGAPNAIVIITGKKSYQPMTGDDDYLTIQNLPAVKTMIQAIEYRENSAPNELWEGRKAAAVKMLSDEVVNHISDPTRTMQRKHRYEQDLITFARNSFGWMRARLALEVPGAMMLGRGELGRILERAEMRAMESGKILKGMIEEFDAKIVGGVVLFPARVEAVLALSLDGRPIEIRSIFHKYQQQGPGNYDCTCDGRVEDEGEHYFPESGITYRKFRFRMGTSAAMQLKAACLLRYVPKKPAEQMTLKNLGAMTLMCDALIRESREQWAEAKTAISDATEVFENETRDYLMGIQPLSGITGEDWQMESIGNAW